MDTTKLFTYEAMLEFVREHVGVSLDTETHDNYGGYNTTVIAKAVLRVPGEPEVVLDEDYHNYSG